MLWVGFTLLKQSDWFHCSRQDRLMFVTAVEYKVGHTHTLYLCLPNTYLINQSFYTDILSVKQNA